MKTPARISLQNIQKWQGWRLLQGEVVRKALLVMSILLVGMAEHPSLLTGARARKKWKWKSLRTWWRNTPLDPQEWTTANLLPPSRLLPAHRHLLLSGLPPCPLPHCRHNYKPVENLIKSILLTRYSYACMPGWASYSSDICVLAAMNTTPTGDDGG